MIKLKHRRLLVFIFSIFLFSCQISFREKVSSPIFSPYPAVYDDFEQNVILSCSTPGAKIFYTLDGSYPTTESNLYPGPIFISYEFVSIKAIAAAAGMDDSDISIGYYKLRIVIEDFATEGGFSSGYSSDYAGEADGPRIATYRTWDNYQLSYIKYQEAMVLTGDSLGEPGSRGNMNTGYSYLQIIFDAPRDGYIKFNYLSWGYDIADDPVQPNGRFEFWMDLDISEIETPSASPDWTNSFDTLDGFKNSEDYFYMDEYDNPVYVDRKIYLPNAGIYRLTWKATKDFTGLPEDLVAVTDVHFSPPPPE